jgi:Flp pilus assembly protein TadD
MFSKKKKVDAKPDAKATTPAPAAAGDSESSVAGSSATESSTSVPLAPEEGGGEGASSGGLLASGLGAKVKTPSISASRLGGRPPSRPSAPAPPPAPASAEPASSFGTAQTPGLPFGGIPAAGQATGTSSGQGNPSLGGASESELSRSGKMATMQGMVPGSGQVTAQGVLALQDAGADGAAKVKNPYKPNLLFDVIVPFSLFVICCGGFFLSTKIVKEKHFIYGWTEAEKQTQVRDQYLASAKLMDDVKKMEPLKSLDAGDSAGALTAAKAMGSAALQVADQQGMGAPQKGAEVQASKNELDAEEKTVRELLTAGMVMCRAGTKPDKELGLKYMAKAEDIATYSKYVRLLYARELVAMHRDDEATVQYEKIAELFKDPWPIAHKELAQLYMRTNKGPDAVRELTVLMKEDPSDPSYQRQLGLAMAQNGDQQAGFEEFQKGFTREQDVLSYPAAVKGLVEAHGGLVDATLADVKKQAQKNPSDIKLQLDLARLDIATLKYKEARDVMENARKTQELNPEVHEVMAEVMCRQNQQSSGYDEFRSAAQNLHLQQ